MVGLEQPSEQTSRAHLQGEEVSMTIESPKGEGDRRPHIPQRMNHQGDKLKNALERVLPLKTVFSYHVLNEDKRDASRTLSSTYRACATPISHSGSAPFTF